MVVLDTCAIIELFKESPTFSSKTYRLIESGARVLSVSFAEIACKVRLGKLQMNRSTRDIIQELSAIEAFNLIDISSYDWLDSVELMWEENRDPADRLITAYAIKHELPIVSTDKKMQKFYPNVIW